jgi:hypothetical protein
VNIKAIQENVAQGRYITAYEPDPMEWERDWKTRKRNPSLIPLTLTLSQPGEGIFAEPTNLE